MHRLHAILVLLAVLGAGACGGTGEGPAGPTPPPATGSTVYYTAIGASDAAGAGSSAPCIPFTECPNGLGYVPVIVRQLQGQGIQVTLSNLGIPAAVLSPRFQSLGRQFGREIPGNFIEQEVPFVPRTSTVVTIFAGGNDTNTVSAAIGGGAGGSDPVAYVDQQINAFREDFATLLAGVRERVPSARIVVANLPNFAGIPMTANYTYERKQLLQKISVGFSTQVINPLASQNVFVVDLLCDARFTQAAYFSSDGFHPNDAGYAAMAGEMMKAILATSYPAPRSSCAQMTIVTPR